MLIMTWTSNQDKDAFTSNQDWGDVYLCGPTTHAKLKKGKEENQ